MTAGTTNSTSSGDTKKLWGGRFGSDQPLNALLDRLNRSIAYDRRLYRHDIQGSIAYAQALSDLSLITPSENTKISEGLRQIEQEWAEGTFKILESDEDIHTANERRLGEIAGKDVAGKLHTGRSRNDQVATDLRMFLRDVGKEMAEGLKKLVLVMCDCAERDIEIMMPAFTHLQRAQPILWSHFLLNHAFALHSDLTLLHQTLSRLNHLPLGSGAIAGHPFGIDRHSLSTALGFSHPPIPNSIHATTSRDFVTEFLFFCATVSTHLANMANDFVVFSTKEFGFVRLGTGVCTGSSLMPQKKNPDSLELIRGKAGRCIGHLAGWMTTQKGLGSGYFKDLQEDKEHVFDAIDIVSDCLALTKAVLETMEVNKSRMESCLGPEMMATELAEFLVRRGTPFREAHGIVGKAVLASEQERVPLDKVDLSKVHPAFEGLGSEDMKGVFDYRASVEKKSAFGGTSTESVRKQISMLRDGVEEKQGSKE